MRRWGREASPCLAVSPLGPTRMSDRFQASIAQLWVYPIKSCAGMSLTQAELTDDGLLFDRSWMVVDAHGDFVSQRECPRMALIQPTVTPTRQLVVRAPGMPDLSVAWDSSAQPLRVRVWDDELEALGVGEAAADWFTQCLNPEGGPVLGRLRLVCFDPQGRRVSERRWTGAGGATLEAVKPCGRCPIPNIDPDTALSSPAVGDTLQTYRVDPQHKGAITFGMNAAPLEWRLSPRSRKPRHEPPMRHRGFAQRRQIHPLQRPDQSRYRG